MSHKTHKDFKSVIPSIKNVSQIFSIIELALSYQHIFKKRMAPWELKEFPELQEFQLKVEDIDRLYYISRKGCSFQLIARLDYKKKPLYVQLLAGCEFEPFECPGGVFFVSRDANIFMHLVGRPLDKTQVYESLAEDGIHVEKRKEGDLDYYSLFARIFWKTPPTLQFLCHGAVFLSRDRLSYASVLPVPLVESVDQYVRMKEARAAYLGFDVDAFRWFK